MTFLFVILEISADGLFIAEIKKSSALVLVQKTKDIMKISVKHKKYLMMKEIGVIIIRANTDYHILIPIKSVDKIALFCI